METAILKGGWKVFSDGRLTLDLSEVRKKKRPTGEVPDKIEIELANVEKANLVPEF